MKKRGFLVLAGVLMLSAAGCSGQSKSQNPPAQSAAETKGQAAAETAAQEEEASEKETAGEAPESSAAEWKPEGPVSLVLPASPGGTVDLSARIWAQYVKEVCGWDAVVVNSAGASGSVAANAVLSSKPDGLTVLYGHNLVNVANVAGVTDYNYEAFTLGPNFSEEPAQQLYTNTEAYPDLESFIADAKANPGKLQACTEVGAYTYYELLAFEQAAGIDLDFVDVGSTSEKMAALLGKQVVLSPSSYGVAKDYIEAGQFTCIGFPGPEETDVLPGIKTFKEQGIDVEFAPQDFSFYFPKGTPEEVVRGYENATKKMLENKDCLEALSSLGQVPKFMTAEEAAENEAKLFKQFKELQDFIDQENEKAE